MQHTAEDVRAYKLTGFIGSDIGMHCALVKWFPSVNIPVLTNSIWKRTTRQLLRTIDITDKECSVLQISLKRISLMKYMRVLHKTNNKEKYIKHFSHWCFMFNKQKTKQNQLTVNISEQSGLQKLVVVPSYVICLLERDKMYY